jgi:hypothetical protein
MKAITCRITDKLNAQLSAVARRERISKSAVIRRALEQYLARLPEKPTVYHLLADVCGSVEGPSDLSWNPRYLDDLGV